MSKSQTRPANLPKLVIANKNYSSWSLRAWLLLKAFDVDFTEIFIQLFDPRDKPTLDRYAANGKVPVLVIGNDSDNEKDNGETISVSESLAIALYTHEYLTSLDIWSGQPKSSETQLNWQQKKQRALCQSIVAEMSTGFMGVRNDLPMNIRVTAKANISDASVKDLQRIEDIFEQCDKLRQTKTTESQADSETAGYLFGEFTIADAWYAPVIFRLHSYAQNSSLTLRASTQRYIETMLNNPHMQAWQQDALQETRVLDDHEGNVKILSVRGALA